MSDGGVTAGHSDDVIGGLSTLPNISVGIGSDVDGGVVRGSQQDRGIMIQLGSRDDVKEQLEIKHKKTIHNTSFSSSKSVASSPQSEFSVLFYFFS